MTTPDTDRTDDLPPPDMTYSGPGFASEYRYYESDTVRRLLAERDDRITQLQRLLSACVDSLAGYRREHGHEQACDAERDARAELGGQNHG